MTPADEHDNFLPDDIPHDVVIQEALAPFFGGFEEARPAAESVRDLLYGDEYKRVVVSTEDLATALTRLPHAHQRPGIWDSDNGERSGTECGQCAAWLRLRAALPERTADER